jgi:chromosome segregation ATPase
MTANQIEAQLERFNTERKELFAKIEQLNSVLTTKDRELTIVKNKFESTIEDADKRKKVLDEAKSEFQAEKQKLNEKIE